MMSVMKSSMKALRGVVLAALCWGAAQPASAAVTVIDPALPVAGSSQQALAEAWWQWVMGIPQSSNPVADPDGRFAGINNNGPVFFIAGGGGGLERSFTVPHGKPIFFPLLNAINVSSHYFDGVEAYCPEQPDPLGCAFSVIGYWIDYAGERHASLDGMDINLFPNNRQRSSDFFPVTVPEEDLYDWNDPPVALPAGTFPAVSDGFWLAVEGIPIGEHVLEFGGTWPWGGTLNVVANINVIPEPSSGMALLAGLSAMAALRRRKRV
ncbi:MAG: hypothetical protein RIR70_1885 [Pseudomonadota bacterium]